MADLDAQITASDTMADIVRLRGAHDGPAHAFTFDDEVLTFSQLDEGSNRAAQALIAEGVKKGDRIAYLGKNHHLYFELFMGAAKLGAVMTPVNWRLAPPEVAYILDNCEAEIVFVAEGFGETIAKVLPQCPHVTKIIGMDAGVADLPDYRAWRDRRGIARMARTGCGRR